MIIPAAIARARTSVLRGTRRHPGLVTAIVVMVLVVSAVVVTAAVAGGAGGADRARRVGDGVVEQFPRADREVLGEITGELLDGKNFSSDAFDGQVLVYNVWGSWCAPCRTEAPVLRRVHEETRGRGVVFVGVNVRDNDSSAKAFERRYGIEYPSINTDTAGDALRAFGNAVPPSAVPTTLVVDEDGRLAARVVGPVTYGTLSTLVEDEIEGTPGLPRGPGAGS